MARRRVHVSPHGIRLYHECSTIQKESHQDQKKENAILAASVSKNTFGGQKGGEGKGKKKNTQDTGQRTEDIARERESGGRGALGNKCARAG